MASWREMPGRRRQSRAHTGCCGRARMRRGGLAWIPYARRRPSEPCQRPSPATRAATSAACATDQGGAGSIASRRDAAAGPISTDARSAVCNAADRRWAAPSPASHGIEPASCFSVDHVTPVVQGRSSGYPAALGRKRDRGLARPATVHAFRRAALTQRPCVVVSCAPRPHAAGHVRQAKSPEGLRRLLQGLAPFAECGHAVHLGAVGEGALASGHVLGFAAPRLQCGCLQRAAVGEGELPREGAERVHQREMRRGVLVRLSAREEGDASQTGAD